MRNLILSAAILFGAGHVSAQQTPDAPGHTPPAPTPVSGEEPAASDEDGDDGGRIVNGEPARREDARWQAQIFAKGEVAWGDWNKDQRCGGALIKSGWVVTAAHCTKLAEGSIFDHRGVKLGSLDAKGGEEYRITQVITHKYYEYLPRGADASLQVPINDIALLRIEAVPGSRAPDFTPQVIRILGSDRRDLSLLADRDVMVTGWGWTEARRDNGGARTVAGGINKKARFLQKTALRLELPSACSTVARYKPALSARTLCAGSPQGNDSCNGDSGGPLTRMEGSERVLVGLVSHGYGCGLVGTNALYVDMTRYIQWINKVIALAEAGRLKNIDKIA